MSGPYAILRLEKVKSMRHLRARSDHNSRADPRGIEHADPANPPTLLAGRADAVEAWNERTESLGIDPTRLRPDAVLGLEFVASASPSFWSSASEEQRTKWTADTMAFLAEQVGGEDNILSAFMHDDESTPHIQLLAVPAVQKAMKKRGRPRKGRPPAEASGEPSWTLSARDLIGGTSHRLVEMQDAYAERMEPLGLQRGIPRKETAARNRSPAHWRAEQARHTDAARETRAGATKHADEIGQTAMKAGREILKTARIEAKRVKEEAAAERDQVRDAWKALEARRLAVDRDAQIVAAARRLDDRPPLPEIDQITSNAQARRQRRRQRDEQR